MAEIKKRESEWMSRFQKNENRVGYRVNETQFLEKIARVSPRSDPPKSNPLERAVIKISPSLYLRSFLFA